MKRQEDEAARGLQACCHWSAAMQQPTSSCYGNVGARLLVVTHPLRPRHTSPIKKHTLSCFFKPRKHPKASQSDLAATMPGPERRQSSLADAENRVEPYSEAEHATAHPTVAAPAAAAATTAAAAAGAPAPAAATAAAAPSPAAQQAAFQAAIGAAAAKATAHHSAAPVPEPEPGGPTFLRISATGNVKQVAGKIAHTCRAGDAPAILSTGGACINQASKSIAIARGALCAGPALLMHALAVSCVHSSAEFLS